MEVWTPIYSMVWASSHRLRPHKSEVGPNARRRKAQKTAYEEIRLAQQAELEHAQQGQKLDGDPELMHDQELIANVADAHARGFQKLMNPDCVRAKAQNRYPSASLSAESTSRIHNRYKRREQPQ